MTSANQIAELRHAVVNDPRNAELRYVLGAEMAQQQDYDGAVMEMSAAIALNPLLHTARFQLGLLHLTMGRADHAVAVFSPLENLDDTSALKHFKRGLEALVGDDFVNCVAYLKSGLELNGDNAPLNRDMNLLLERVSTQVKNTLRADAPGLASSESSSDTAVRTDFSLYSGPKN